MKHDEHCGCNCNHDHHHKTDDNAAPIELTENQINFLHQLCHSHYLPVAQFTLMDSRE